MSEVSNAVTRVLEELGFERCDSFPAETGSWFKKWFVRSRDELTRPEVLERLKKSERALELEYLHTKQAEADKHQAEGAAALIQALQSQNAAVCQIGSILLVKTTDGTGHSQVVTRTLSQAEIIALEKSPSALKSPDEVARFLDARRLERQSPGVLPDGD